MFDTGLADAVKEAMEFIIKDSRGAALTLVYPCLLGHVAMSYTTPPTVRLTSGPGNGTYTFVPHSASWFESAMNFDRDNHILVYSIRRAGADIMDVYKYKVQFGWRCGNETVSNYVY
jgi:hypothetical protein